MVRTKRRRAAPCLSLIEKCAKKRVPDCMPSMEREQAIIYILFFFGCALLLAHTVLHTRRSYEIPYCL